MTLVELLDDGARHAPEYDGSLSNHLPMALVALQRLGADDARLQAFAARYARRLEAADAAQDWPLGDAWPGRFGERAAFATYRSLFVEWRAQEGARDMLAQVLPPLMRGCGAAAFHGLIRTAYAVHSRHAGELASGLAYWACRWLPLGPLPSVPVDEPAATTDPEPLLRRLRAGRSTAGLIVERMRAAAADDRALHAEVARLAVDEFTLERLARLAAHAYAHSGNFTALHLLTSAHALRVLSPFVDEPQAAWRWYWQAFAVAVAAARLRVLPPPALQPWERIVGAALASDDEHVIKLVDSCREQEQAYGGDIWRLAASRVLAA